MAELIDGEIGQLHDELGCTRSPNRVWVDFWPIDRTDLQPSPTRVFEHGDLSGVEIGASESTNLTAEFSDDTWSKWHEMACAH